MSPLQHTSNNWTQPEQTFYSTQTQDSTVRTLTDCPSCVFYIHSIKNKDSFKVKWLDLDYPVSSGGLTSSCFENLIRDLRSLTNQLTQTHWPSHVTDSTSQTELELKAAAADWMMNCCPCMKFKHTPRRSSKCSLWLQTHITVWMKTFSTDTQESDFSDFYMLLWSYWPLFIQTWGQLT